VTIWENRNLREANTAAAQADSAWREHRDDCPACTKGQRTRDLTLCCKTGWAIYKQRRDAQAQLAEERKLAKQPVPGQADLFPGLTS
jgi:hypothetical protein